MRKARFTEHQIIAILKSVEQETLWLLQATIANLYQAITQHIKAIYEEGELEQNATCKSYLQVQQEDGRRKSTDRIRASHSLLRQKQQ